MRAATDNDQPRLTEIYNHYIAGSHVSFDATMAATRQFVAGASPHAN